MVPARSPTAVPLVIILLTTIGEGCINSSSNSSGTTAAAPALPPSVTATVAGSPTPSSTSTSSATQGRTATATLITTETPTNTPTRTSTSSATARTSATATFTARLTTTPTPWVARSTPTATVSPSTVATTSPTAEGISYPLPQTGQTQCEQADGTLGGCPGSPARQDGELQEGVPRNFADNGDGTITDNVTGLMWEKLSADRSIHDYTNTYTWYESFTDKIATLNSGTGFAGYADWRLPNINELQSLANYGTTNPAIDVIYFGALCANFCTAHQCSCTQSYYYWSSTTYDYDSSRAWQVYFLDGSLTFEDKSSPRFVRAVRGNASKRLRTGQDGCDNGDGTLGVCPGSPAGQDGELQEGVARNSTDNGDGTITDHVTGLMWEKLSADGSIHDYSTQGSWAEAFEKIMTLN